VIKKAVYFAICLKSENLEKVAILNFYRTTYRTTADKRQETVSNDRLQKCWNSDKIYGISMDI
jgi:hypothetical protein